MGQLQPQPSFPHALEGFLEDVNSDLGKRNFLAKYPMASSRMENAKISCIA